MAYVAGAIVLAAMLARTPAAGRVLRHLLTWGALGLACYVLLTALGAPPAWRVPVNVFTVGTAALLGPPGVGLAILAHAMYR